MLNMFPDLGKARKRKAGSLSAGQRTMLGIARALMVEPKVVMLDEPTAGLAPGYVATVWSQIRLIARSGVGVVVVEQSVDLALDNADRAYVLVAGRNLVDASAEAIREEVDLKRVFLGDTDTPKQVESPTNQMPI
jgi:branched-chain amino acid transport system ATP-binding protein